MKWLKSDFSKFHFLFLLFALLNIGFGLALYFSAPYFGTILYAHLFAGILLFAIPILTLLFIKDRTRLLAAFKARLFVNKNDRKYKKTMLIVAKITADAISKKL